MTETGRVKLLIPAQDGHFPYLTDYLLREYFNPKEDRIRENLIISICVKDTCVVATYNDKVKHNLKRKRHAAHDSVQDEMDDSMSTKPTGYTFSRAQVHLMPEFVRMLVPTLDLLDDAESESQRSKTSLSVVSNNNHLSLYTPNGLQQISPKQLTEIAIELQSESFVPLFDQCDSSGTKKRGKCAVERTKQWLENCISLLIRHENETKQIVPVIAPLLCSNCEEILSTCLDHLESVVTSIYGIALVGFHHQTERLQRDVILNCNKRLHHLPITVLATSSLRQILIAAECGVSIIGSSLPIIWACSNKAFILNDANEDLDDNRCFDVSEMKYVRDTSPLCRGCKCPACKNDRYSRAYIHHLIKAKEMIADILLVSHNMYQFIELFVSLNMAKSKGPNELISYIESIRNISKSKHKASLRLKAS